MKPKLSVHMPVYNTSKYLESAIKSIFDQTFTDFELIAINDGSTDSSNNILNRLASEDNRLRVFNRRHLGQAATRNEALSMAKGKYFGAMDSDDISRSTRFKKQIEYLDSHPLCVAVGCQTLFIDPDGAPLRVFKNKPFHVDIDRADMIGHGGELCHPATIMRKSSVIKVGGYEQDYPVAHDFDLFLKLAEVGYLHNLEEVLFEYRQHPKSISCSQRSKQKKVVKKALKAAYLRRNLPPIKDENIYPMREVPKHKLYLKWAWWAYESGYIGTARKHAFRAFILQPWSLSSWRAFAYSFRRL